MPESKNQSKQKEPSNINDPIDLQQQFDSSLHKDNDDDNKAKPAQKLSSSSTDVNAPPTYPPLNNDIMELFYDLHRDMKEFQVSQLQSWELFKDNFTAKTTYIKQKKSFEDITLLYGNLEDFIGEVDVTEQKMLQVADCNRKH